MPSVKISGTGVTPQGAGRADARMAAPARGGRASIPGRGLRFAKRGLRVKQIVDKFRNTLARARVMV